MSLFIKFFCSSSIARIVAKPTEESINCATVSLLLLASSTLLPSKETIKVLVSSGVLGASITFELKFSVVRAVVSNCPVTSVNFTLSTDDLFTDILPSKLANAVPAANVAQSVTERHANTPRLILFLDKLIAVPLFQII